MSILFLSDREDPIMFSTYQYFSDKTECGYNVGMEPELIIANHPVSTDKKVIFYGTNPNENFTSNLQSRRTFLTFFNNCHSLVCSSVYLAKNFYSAFRLEPTIQYPFVQSRDKNPSYIAHSNDFTHLSTIRDEIWEDFLELTNPQDIINAKIYLLTSSSFLDLGLCYATACGVPVVMYDNPALTEFLEPTDIILNNQTTIQQKIQLVKQALKDHTMKPKLNKYSNMSALEDKIKQALAKRYVDPKLPFAVPQPPQPIKPKPVIRGRREHRQVRQVTQKPELIPIKENTIYINGSIVNISGYDNFVYELIKGMYLSSSIDVRINSRSSINFSLCPPYFRDIYLPKPNDAWEIIILPPPLLDRVGPTKKSIIYTMWETDHIIPHWVNQINLASMVIVPSQWAVDCFKKDGVTIPIHKIPLGADTSIFYPSEIKPHPFTLGTAAALTSGGIRKNTDKIISLFQEAFNGIDNVKLKVKITPNCKLSDIKDHRIEIIRSFLPPRELADWYRSIDVFINGSYAEGFGLHMLEAMACGCPLISTNYSAVTEYFNEDVGWVVDHEIIRASGNVYSGHWARPVDQSLISQMRYAYNNPQEAKEKGEKAYLKASQLTWENTNLSLIELLKIMPK